jgi:hypothetical protein
VIARLRDVYVVDDTTAVDTTVDLSTDARNHAPRVIERTGYKADGAGWIGATRLHLFVVPREGSDPAQLTSGEMSAGAAFWSPDGTRIAYVQDTERPNRDLEPESAVWVITVAGGTPKRVTPDGWLASSVSWSANGQTLLITGSPASRVGHSQLYTVPATGDTPQPVTETDRNVMVGAPGYPVRRPVWLPDGRILFCVRERGRVHILCAEVGAPPVSIVNDETMVVSGMDARDGRIVFVAGSQESPGEVYITDLGSGTNRRLTSLFADALPDVRVRRPENLTFTAPDGTAIEGWLLQGSEDGPRPLLLDIHGGPHNAWGPTLDGAHLYHQTLAASGWNILYINPRGSDGYGESFILVHGAPSGVPASVPRAGTARAAGQTGEDRPCGTVPGLRAGRVHPRPGALCRRRVPGTHAGGTGTVWAAHMITHGERLSVASSQP